MRYLFRYAATSVFTSSEHCVQPIVPPLSDWLNTVAWYGLVPILRILGAAVFVAGLVSLRSSGHGGASGLGLVAMVAGGILLLVPEIVNAIYTKTTVGASWATTPGS